MTRPLARVCILLLVGTFAFPGTASAQGQSRGDASISLEFQYFETNTTT